MKLSPEDKRTVLGLVAQELAQQVMLEGGGAMTSVVILPMGVAEKMLSLTAKTIRANMEWVELAAGKHGVRLSVVQEFLAARSRQPKRERSAA